MKQKDHRKSALGSLLCVNQKVRLGFRVASWFFNSRVDIPVDIPKCTPP